ncbi:MAG: AsmA family protein [Pseudomonadota bacterium]
MLVTLVLYLSFGDLSRHKGRLESYLTQRLGRPFAIDGKFTLDLFPAVKVEAQNVRIGNTSWGTAPQMLQVGRFATQINLRSLFSGPVDVHTLELRDVTVLLERNSSGDVNWDFGKSGSAESAGGSRHSPGSAWRAGKPALRGAGRIRASGSTHWRQPQGFS